VRESRDLPTQSFRAQRGRVCVRVFIGVSVRVVMVSVRACCERLYCTI
jgi:hypothetical protein